MEPRKLAEIEAHAQFLRDGHPNVAKPFGPAWGAEYWGKWATIIDAFVRLQIPEGARVLDVGCGPGWTSLFLAESGYATTAFDIAPAAIEMAAARAARSGLDIRFEVADMEVGLPQADEFDAVLVFDALHHSERPADVVASLARHLRPGAWVLFGEPSWLHSISPGARRASRDLGWLERGITARALRRWCHAAGLGETRRFFEPTRPYESRLRGFCWQAVRLAAANVAVAPQASIWLAARRSG